MKLVQICMPETTLEKTWILQAKILSPPMIGSILIRGQRNLLESSGTKENMLFLVKNIKKYASMPALWLLNNKRKAFLVNLLTKEPFLCPSMVYFAKQMHRVCRRAPFQGNKNSHLVPTTTHAHLQKKKKFVQCA